MLTKQPFYVGGFENLEEANFAKNNAFGAVGMFVFSFTASLFGLYFHSRKEIEPNDLEALRPLRPNGMSAYQVELSEGISPYRD